MLTILFFHRWRFIPGTKPTRYRCDDCGKESATWSKRRDCAVRAPKEAS